MLYSMTGFGRAEGSVPGRQIVVEVKSLNGKGFEMAPGKLPAVLRPYEADVRGTASKGIIRGTTDLSITIRQEGGARPLSLNMELAESYYHSMQALAQHLSVPEGDLLPVILRMPEIMATGAEAEVLSDEDWHAVRAVIEAAIAKLTAHRRTEGMALERDLAERIAAIEAGAAAVKPLEGGRIERLRERLNAALERFGGESKDPNRFEQELIYYIEKIDISEEQVRLGQHLRYFREVMANGDVSKGKVLGFILQEIGREINTLGSKANDAAIQKLVVGMKDELEKAKEQALNVL